MAAQFIPSSVHVADGSYPCVSQEEFYIEDLGHVTEVDVRYPPSSLTSEQKVSLGDMVFAKFGKDSFLNYYYAYKLTEDERSQIYQLAMLRSVEMAAIEAIAGIPVYLRGINGEQTYARRAPSDAGEFREIISKICHLGSNDFKIHGEACHSASLKFQEESSSAPESREHGLKAYFTTVRTYDNGDQKRFDNCMKYAILNYDEAIEERCGDRISTLEHLEEPYYFNHIVQKYFRNISSSEHPQDGDLAVYENPIGATWEGRPIAGIVHAGIFRTGGTIESKWGWSFSHHVYQHYVFFAPHHYGTVVKFYRLRGND